MEKTKRRSIKSKSGTPAITEVFEVEFLSLSACVHPALLWQPHRNVAATLSARHPADALEVSMATAMASHDCEGQSEPINGTRLRDKKKQQHTGWGSNHKLCFLSLLFLLCQKMSVCVLTFACFPCLPLSYCLCKPVRSVCRQCVGCTGGREHECLFFSDIDWLLTTTLLLHCEAKALKGI